MNAASKIKGFKERAASLGMEIETVKEESLGLPYEMYIARSRCKDGWGCSIFLMHKPACKDRKRSSTKLSATLWSHALSNINTTTPP